MPWSTRELAELAGTTVNTVRHYHRLDLLEEPDRTSNGYKQYGVRHLVALLRIRRLTDLCVPLARISAVSTDADEARDALHALQDDIGANIRRLEQAQADIAAILRTDSPADAPAGFESVAARMSDADGSIIHIYRLLYDDDALADIRDMVEADPEAMSTEFAALPADADEERKQRLVEELTPVLAQRLRDYPWLNDQEPHLSKSAPVTTQMLDDAVAELYNRAQLEVLARAGVLASAQVSSPAPPAPPAEYRSDPPPAGPV